MSIELVLSGNLHWESRVSMGKALCSIDFEIRCQYAEGISRWVQG